MELDEKTGWVKRATMKHKMDGTVKVSGGAQQGMQWKMKVDGTLTFGSTQ